MIGLGTSYRFLHTRRHPETGQKHVIWGSGVGEFDVDERITVPDIVGDAAWIHNELADQGEQNMLDVYYRAAAAAVSPWYFRLYNDTPLDTDTLATLVGEVTGTGYAAIAVARNATDWPTLGLVTGDYRVESVTKTYNATGTWTAATQLVHATTSDNTGLFLAWAALSATRTLVNGDSLNVSMRVSQA